VARHARMTALVLGMILPAWIFWKLWEGIPPAIIERPSRNTTPPLLKVPDCRGNVAALMRSFEQPASYALERPTRL